MDDHDDQASIREPIPGRHVDCLLINPPLTDPTGPYHSLSYLVGAAQNAGYSGLQCIDANVEALNFMADPEQFGQLLDQCTTLRSRLEGADFLTRSDQLNYRYALKSVGMQTDSAARAIDIFRDPDSFYRYDQYRDAVRVITRWLDLLSIYGYPGQFDGFSLDASGVCNFNSIEDLTDITRIDRLARPLSSYFHGPFKALLGSRNWRVVGISINYLSQLPFGIWLSHLVRKELPDCLLCVGGTEVTDDVKYARDPHAVWTIFSSVDAVVVGEGETAFTKILDAVWDESALDPGTPGLLLRSSVPMATLPQLQYESLVSLPSPVYDIWDYSQYWAPEPVLMYSPTRGCYWNKCTFCDYGLNTDGPTSPSRERPVERILEDLAEITRIARTIYLAVDAMSPRFLRRWARSLIESQIAIHWSAELRLERTFVKGLAEELSDAGCVALSFGYESGSQRILNLIDKGVRIESLPDILDELGRVAIGVQMMGFIGFPTETKEEALETFSFLRKYRKSWALAAIGDFVLTPGAIVAKNFADFGIAEVAAFPGDDIVRSLYWAEGGQLHGIQDERTKLIDRVAAEIDPMLDSRPFVGGIDSAHSILYFTRYGPSLVPKQPVAEEKADQIVQTVTYWTPLDVDRFTDNADVARYRVEQRSLGHPVTAESVVKWLGEPTYSRPFRGAGQSVEIFPGGLFMASPGNSIFRGSEAYRILKHRLLKLHGIV